MVGWLDQDDVQGGKKGEGGLQELSDSGVEVVLDETPDNNADVVEWVISFNRQGKKLHRRYENWSEVDRRDKQPNVRLELC